MSAQSTKNILTQFLPNEMISIIQDYLFNENLHKSNVANLITDLKEFQGTTNLGEYLSFDKHQSATLSDTVNWRKRQYREKFVKECLYDDFSFKPTSLEFIKQYLDDYDEHHINIKPSNFKYYLNELDEYGNLN